MKLPEKLLKRLDGLNDYDTAVRPVFDDGFMTCWSELEPLISAIKLSIARSEDYGDSYCSQPIREALKNVFGE